MGASGKGTGAWEIQQGASKQEKAGNCWVSRTEDGERKWEPRDRVRER